MNGSSISEIDDKLLNVKSVNFDRILYVDCYYNKVSLPELKIMFSMNEAQKRLMLCLLRGISSKQEIMQVVWNDSHLRLRDNNYHQLVFQMRALLLRNGLPAELIMTIPHYGLKLNAPLLQSLVECRSSAVNEFSENNVETERIGSPVDQVSEEKPQAECAVSSQSVTGEQRLSVKHWFTNFVFYTRFYLKKN